MSILNSDPNKMTKQSGGKVGRLVFTMNEVGQPCCEVNVYWTGGNVTDPADGLLLQAARLWQTCTRPNTQCVLESNQPTVDSIEAETTQNGQEKEKKFIEFRAKHQFVFVCLWLGCHTQIYPSTHPHFIQWWGERRGEQTIPDEIKCPASGRHHRNYQLAGVIKKYLNRSNQ